MKGVTYRHREVEGECWRTWRNILEFRVFMTLGYGIIVFGIQF